MAGWFIGCLLGWCVLSGSLDVGGWQAYTASFTGCIVYNYCCYPSLKVIGISIDQPYTFAHGMKLQNHVTIQYGGIADHFHEPTAKNKRIMWFFSCGITSWCFSVQIMAPANHDWCLEFIVYFRWFGTSSIHCPQQKPRFWNLSPSTNGERCLDVSQGRTTAHNSNTHRQFVAGQ